MVRCPHTASSRSIFSRRCVPGYLPVHPAVSTRCESASLLYNSAIAETSTPSSYCRQCLRVNSRCRASFQKPPSTGPQRNCAHPIIPSQIWPKNPQLTDQSVVHEKQIRGNTVRTESLETLDSHSVSFAGPRHCPLSHNVSFHILTSNSLLSIYLFMYLCIYSNFASSRAPIAMAH